MAHIKKRSRFVIAGIVIGLIAAAVTAAFWPRPVLVDFGTVTRGPMMVTIDEEGRTEVREPYVVVTPFAGRLQRVTLHAGDVVIGGETIVAHMLPTNPAALDARTKEQAQAAVSAANAALLVAQADLNAALANSDLAQSELARTKSLHARNIASDAALERAEQLARVADASVDVAKAAIAIREANVQNAEAQLIGFDENGLAALVTAPNGNEIPLRAPASGSVLRVIQENETTLPAGAPIMEIGNIKEDLEVIVSLVSSDAVQVRVGDRVIIDGWGGAAVLEGEVRRIDPFGTTKISALGVEEQRVPLTVTITSPATAFEGLGHGFRVDAHIVVWDEEDALRVPTSALFRVSGESDSGADDGRADTVAGTGWAVFTVADGKVNETAVAIGQDNGRLAQVLGGLTEGQTVVLYPATSVQDGSHVASRSLE